MDENPKLLKQDVRGRVRTPVERREMLLEEFERSGLSGPKFAGLVGVKYQTFAGWVHERRKKPPTPRALPASTGSSLRLVEAVVAPDAREPPLVVGCSAGALQVHLGEGVRLEIGHASQLQLAVSFIRALNREARC
jgi:hypothetical protein